ncbi:MAG: hypothetical protein IJU84_08405 [Clostridia bacterium]|nr:hypothetical protein [Clostridia bacterium]
MKKLIVIIITVLCLVTVFGVFGRLKSYFSNSELTISNESIVSDSTPLIVRKNITENGTYLASDDNADGYSVVTVNIADNGVVLPEYVDYRNQPYFSEIAFGPGTAFSFSTDYSYTIGSYYGEGVFLDGYAFGYTMDNGLTLIFAWGAIVKNDIVYTVVYAFDNAKKMLYAGYVDSTWENFYTLTYNDVVYVKRYTGYSLGDTLYKANDTSFINLLPVSAETAISGTYEIYRGYGTFEKSMCIIDHSYLEMSTCYDIMFDICSSNGFFRYKAASVTGGLIGGNSKLIYATTPTDKWVTVNFSSSYGSLFELYDGDICLGEFESFAQIICHSGTLTIYDKGGDDESGSAIVQGGITVLSETDCSYEATFSVSSTGTIDISVSD